MKWLVPGSLFPDIDTATHEGVVAFGGSFDWKVLLNAYSYGIFPWSNPGEAIVWWSPNPRFVIFPDNLRVHRSMRPYINQRRFRVTYDTRFGEVIERCRKSKRQGEYVGSWIGAKLIAGYTELHRRGFAHSVEVWDDNDRLVGGLYGVALGRIFCGESMFTDVPNASKYGFIHLAKNLRRRGYWLIDCQMDTPHLRSLGGTNIPRREFKHLVELNHEEDTDLGPWTGKMEDDALDDTW